MTSLEVRVVVPDRSIVSLECEKVLAEGLQGYFCLMPRHVDHVTALVPGIMKLTEAGGRERYLAVEEGTLVKRGRLVIVSVRGAVEGELGQLRLAVLENTRRVDDTEQKAKLALNHLEASLVRQMLEWEGRTHG